MKNKKILFDIIINKRTLIEQFYKIFVKLQKDMKKLKNRDYVYSWLDTYLIGLKQYLTDSAKFKKTFDIEQHIRVFDIAYKELNNNWKFIICFADDKKANSDYWENLKQKGKILDYDLLEQYPTDGYVYFDYAKQVKKILFGEKLRKSINPDMEERYNNNWVYSTLTNKWYSSNEEMPEPKITCGVINEIYQYNIDIDTESYPLSEDEQLRDYIQDSYDEDGVLYEDEDCYGYLKCQLTIKNNVPSKFCTIEFDYRNNIKIRNALEKAKNGKYVRFDLGGYKQDRMHIWQKNFNNNGNKDDNYLVVACYEKSQDLINDKEIYCFMVKKEFIDCFINALNKIEHKINTIKSVIKSAKKLKINKNFNPSKGFGNKIISIDNFVGKYACVNNGSFNGWGIINKNFEWVIKPESVTLYGKTNPKFGKEIKGWYLKYYYLHNIDGKLFIAEKQDHKQYVMDIKGDIQIPHVRDKIYYTYLNNKLYFIGADEDETYIINDKGETILKLDFKISEKFWLFEDIIIVSKDEKFGIVNWKGKTLIDFIFSDIKPNIDNLDFIPAKYMDMWGYINKKGKIINMKFKDTLEEDEKCSKVQL